MSVVHALHGFYTNSQGVHMGRHMAVIVPELTMPASGLSQSDSDGLRHEYSRVVQIRADPGI